MKPCPFCGREAVAHVWHFGAYVYCAGCRAHGPEFNHDGPEDEKLAGAVRLWDERPVPGAKKLWRSGDTVRQWEPVSPTGSAGAQMQARDRDAGIRKPSP
jgi:hypothetical protein